MNSSSGWWNCWEDARIVKIFPFSIVNQLVCLCIQGTWESGTLLTTLINIWSPATAMVSFDGELSSLSLSEMISADLILLTQSITLSSIWDLHYVSVTLAYLTGIVGFFLWWEYTAGKKTQVESMRDSSDYFYQPLGRSKMICRKLFWTRNKRAAVPKDKWVT